jgi:DNA polymerase-4
MALRKIIHVDMDAFYASVEQLDFPELRGKPVAVGGNAERGVVAAASYEARKFGVKSAMSSKLAARKCPGLIFVRPRFDRYKEISKSIHEIFSRYTDLIEPLSLDEAFLDVTFNKINLSSATFIAQSIRNDIRNELNLIASAGVSYNKFLAKMASDQDKPNGLFVIRPKDAIAFIDTLTIERFFGVGKVTADKMRELGITNGRELRTLSLEFLTSHFGKSGAYFYNIAQGTDNRTVEPERERKSLGIENTFDTDISDTNRFRNEASAMLQQLWQRYQRHGLQGKTLSIKLKYNDFVQITRAQTKASGLATFEVIEALGNQLVEQLLPLEKPVRLIGFQVSGFLHETGEVEPPASTQMTLDF